MRAHRSVVLAMALAACGPDAKEPAEHDRVCGHESPFRILELDEDRQVAGVQQSRHEDGRRLLSITYGELTEWPFPFPDTPTREYWSVGECGESPELLPEDVAAPWTLQHWPDEVFACDRETGELEIFDPDGVRPRNLVFAAHACDSVETPWGLLYVTARDDDTGVVELLPFPDDPWTETSVPRTLIDEVRIRTAPPYGSNGEMFLFAYFDDVIYALSPTYELLRFSLIDGTTTIEAENVRVFKVSRDEQWLLWQDIVEIGDDPEWPVGAIYLRDRMAGTVERLADAPLAAVDYPDSLDLVDLGVVLLQLGYLYQEPQRVYQLDDLSFIDLPLGMVVHARVSGDRVLIGDRFGHGKYAVVDPLTGQGTPIFDGYGTVRALEDHLEILDGIYCCLKQDERAEGRLWTGGFDGARELLARRVTKNYSFLPDGRLLTLLDVDSKWHGDLVVVDPDDHVERVVDDHVVFSGPAVDDDTIVYGVSDDDRTGVWLARLAPAEE